MDYEGMINRIRKAIYQADQNAEAYLFGSRARGDNLKYSPLYKNLQNEGVRI
jgi:predicted nucleotidyltransferase